jgi:hypothetical protein
MEQLRLKLFMIGSTVLLFSAMLAVNELFRPLEYAPGINWIYLPAGMRLLCTLLFGGAGAIGLLIVSWAICFLYFFPDDFLRAFMGGIIAALAPYLVYLAAQHLYGLRASLTNLTPRALLHCIAAYSVASPGLHHLWFWMEGQREGLLRGFLVMSAGDLAGTLIVVYLAKGLLSLASRRARSV